MTFLLQNMYVVIVDPSFYSGIIVGGCLVTTLDLFLFIKGI